MEVRASTLPNGELTDEKSEQKIPADGGCTVLKYRGETARPLNRMATVTAEWHSVMALTHHVCKTN
jgi:hypothetical protein